ncbi:queuosine precursor transporter [Candidatus Magnetomoraceae bacterium gMMP-15]
MNKYASNFYYIGIIIISLYIATQIISDIASLKIAMIAGFSIDAGTFIYPFTFTIRDLVHKHLGKKEAQLLIFLAATINIVMAGLFNFAAWLPQDPSWGMGDQFSAVLSPVWRIVMASIIAEIISELIDTEIYQLWVLKVTNKYQWSRVFVSNAVSIPIDSFIFCWGAFGLILPNSVVWSIFFSNIIVKGLVTLISLPSIYLVSEKRH